MKKLLLLSTLVFGLGHLNAQCTISPACSTGTIGYCTSPAENTNLPNGTEASAYNTTIQLSLASSAFGGAVAITDATIGTVAGLPSGFTYSTNPASGVMPGGSDGCILITGNPAVGSAGTYTIDVTFNVNTSFGPLPQTLTWYLVIDPNTTGIKSYNQTSMFVSPNPASSELFISASTHFGKVQVMDALGKVVLTHDANYAMQTTVNVSSLSKGVYFIQLNDGKNVMTKKFIKD